MLVLDSIKLSYGQKHILRGVFLSVPKSTLVGLFGNNGSGKSSLIKIAAGFVTQDDGTLFINNAPQKDNYSTHRYKSIGYLSQDSFFPKDLKVKDLLKIKNSESNRLENDLLFDKLKEQKILTLSGGELKYIEVLFLLSLNRQYYLLDEPFTGIEPLMIEKIIELLKAEKESGKGILITDHNYRYLTDVIDKCYLLQDGYINEILTETDFKTGLMDVGYLVK